MTKSDKKSTKDPGKSTKRLSLTKETIRDLEVNPVKGGAVRGGAGMGRGLAGRVEKERSIT